MSTLVSTLFSWETKIKMEPKSGRVTGAVFLFG